MDNIQKYVASRTLKEPLPWKNSILLKGDAADAVDKLRSQPGKDLVIMGSGKLIQSLMRRNLVDEYVLLIHPIVLGTGQATLYSPRFPPAHQLQNDGKGHRDCDLPPRLTILKTYHECFTVPSSRRESAQKVGSACDDRFRHT
jgi:dihydrofolate reductase